MSDGRAWAFLPGQTRIDLVPATPPEGRIAEDLIDPFVTLSDRGSFSRALLAQVVGPSGEPVLPFVLKIQSDEYPIPPGASAVGRWSNRIIEEGWTREAAFAERAGSIGAGIASPIGVLDRSPGEAAELAPTFYCKRRTAFFTARCPTCGQPLADVRDDRTLEGHGIPRFDGSLARFLGCARCISRGQPKFWALIAEDAPEGAPVGDFIELVSAYGRLARVEPEPGQNPVIPCQGCEHVSGCFPGSEGGDAIRLLTPVTFYESRCLAYPLQHLRYDEFCSLAGGAAIDDVTSRVTEPGRLAALADLLPRLGDDQPRFFFGADMAGKFGLEVLRLKLGLFRELCHGVSSLHRYAREPHLGLSPSRAMIQLPPRKTSIPALWSYELSLLGLGNTRSRDLAGHSDDLPVQPLERPRLLDPIYSAPPLRNPELSEHPCGLTLTQAHSQPDGRVVLDGLIESDRVDAGSIGDKDVITAAVVQARPPLSLSIVAAPAATSRGVVHFKSVPLRLAASAAAQIDQLIGQRLGRARFSLLPCFHVPCDVYSLGMVFLTTLLSNVGQEVGEVAEAVDQVSDELAGYARHHPEAGLAGISAKAMELLAGKGSVFKKQQIFHQPERFHQAADGITDAIWSEALLLGLRSISGIRGFSVCRGYSDFDPGHPEVNVEYLLQLVETAIRKVDAALFGLPGRRREIREAIAKVRAGLQRGAPAAPADSSASDVTMVVRPGGRG